MNALILKRLDKASRDGDINELKQLMKEDPSLLDSFDHDVPMREARDNPLHIAASYGHVDFTIEVLQCKPQLAGMPNREGRLPLHFAAARGHVEVVRLFVNQQDARKFSLYSESKYGYMPVHIAAINGKHTIVEMLVERCRDLLDKTTHRKETLIHLAVIANCLDSVRYLITQGVDLNEKDVDGNTCLHLACQKKNHQVITNLLHQEGIEVNSTNARGLTPLDVLLVSSWDSATDVSLVSILRRAGGEEATEQGNPKSNITNSKHVFLGRNIHKTEKPNDAKTLLVVATLVATMTFPAISNPPGGFIQLPFDKDDTSNETFYKHWVDDYAYTAGRPALLWQLKAFFVLDSVALFSSIGVILFLLCGIPKTKIVMKFLVSILWLSVFCTALAFASASLLIYVPHLITLSDSGNLEFHTRSVDIAKPGNRLAWMKGLLIAWCAVFVTAGLWASFQVFRFLWIKGGFKANLPNWIVKVDWPKNRLFKKTTSIICMVCFLAILCLSAYGLWLGFTQE
ncbi:hypothetical protein LUZ61_008655 [Rhynchospora tenuis]|uniref:PGG domain-containing protein n=1 Tax=Rhynchospora tenuis TaxID=198213 RepID=A0AAD6EXT5_9POAL|nr:hypothetical protein LUZ61_008655 [Rhynchospora tenuis]